MLPPSRCLVLSLPLVLAACLSETTFIQPPPPGSDTDTSGGTVQRATLLLKVPVSGPDSVLAAQLGWTSGVIEGAAVTIEREGSAASRRVDTTDAAGTVEFVDLLPGYYRISALRMLTASEVALLDSANRDVSGFGGGRALTVKGPHDTALAGALAGRRGSLVISELFPYTPVINGGSYNFATWLELYNNGDSMVYLDGKLLGLGPGYFRDFTTAVYNQVSCEEGVPYQLDPDGMWSHYIWRFPGSGREYPLGPGQGAVVLATDAVDHTVVAPDLPDLSWVQFEFLGSQDADNPSVPNLVDVGTKEWGSIQGHGYIVGGPTGILYVADAVDLASLPTARMPTQSELSYRIPRASVLDVFMSLYVPDLEAGINLPLCNPMVSPVFDRAPGFLYDRRVPRSIARRPFGTLPDGRRILLRTKATAVDFLTPVAPTPGTVP